MNLQLTDNEAAALHDLLSGVVDGGRRLPMTQPTVDALYEVMMKIREYPQRDKMWCHTCGVWHDTGCMTAGWLIRR